jgi:hypothetical protein
MPWRAPEHPGEFPSLGWLVGEWIEEHCVIPDGDHIGEPYVMTDEQLELLVWHYRLRVDARGDEQNRAAAWAYRRSQWVRPQKWGKGPLSAALICAELFGPVRFAGWDADGEPTGVPWSTPWVQVTATAEGQTDNVWRVLRPMIDEGPLAALADTGMSDINTAGGGFAQIVTSKAGTRLGQRITCAVQDETHSWFEAGGGWALADTQRRNLAGTGGRAIETTNGWDPSEASVAQRTAESKVTDIYRSHPLPAPFSLRNKAERHKALRELYGQCWWVNRDRIDGEVVELMEEDPAQAERFFFNIITSGSGSWFDGDLWAARARPRTVPDGTKIVLGFDGSDVDDWTAIRAETLDGYQFTPQLHSGDRTIWNPADHNGQVPRLEVDAAVHELFTRFDVRRFYCDPPDWKTEIDGWSAEWERRVFRWETYRVTQMHAALERQRTDVMKADTTFTHDGDELAEAHVRNARRAARRRAYVLKKASQAQKIDIAMASALAHEAAGDALAAGESADEPTYGFYMA